jgi:hypothetical protein
MELGTITALATTALGQNGTRRPLWSAVLPKTDVPAFATSARLRETLDEALAHGVGHEREDDRYGVCSLPEFIEARRGDCKQYIRRARNQLCGTACSQRGVALADAPVDLQVAAFFPADPGEPIVQGRHPPLYERITGSLGPV